MCDVNKAPCCPPQPRRHAMTKTRQQTTMANSVNKRPARHCPSRYRPVRAVRKARTPTRDVGVGPMSGTMLAAMLASTPAGTHRGRNVHDAGTQTDDQPPSAFFDEVPTTFFPPPPPYTPVSDASDADQIDDDSDQIDDDSDHSALLEPCSRCSSVGHPTDCCPDDPHAECICPDGRCLLCFPQ